MGRHATLRHPDDNEVTAQAWNGTVEHTVNPFLHAVSQQTGHRDLAFIRIEHEGV
jgi:hypothetical protein